MQIIRLKLRQVSNQGFFVILSCSSQPGEIEGYLAPVPSALITSLQQWQISYRQLEALRSKIPESTKLRIIPQSVVVTSFAKSVDAVRNHLNQWLNTNAGEWQGIRDGLISFANQFKQQEVQMIIDTQDINLCRLPWQEWDLLTQYYSQTEVAISTPSAKDIALAPVNNHSPAKKVRILLVVGHSDGLDTNADLQFIQQLPKNQAEVTCLIEPSLQDLCTYLWCDRGYHIFVFTGHSSSDRDGTIGWIEINPTERLTIAEFKDAFRQGIKQGLQLAIFNSCDGLGLADRLSELNLTQIIVMQEPVPDEVAIEFIKHFFTAFIDRHSLFSAVHQARKKLEGFNSRYPGAVWLPTLCLKPATRYLTWQSMLTGDLRRSGFTNHPQQYQGQGSQHSWGRFAVTTLACCVIFFAGFCGNLLLLQLPQLKSLATTNKVAFVDPSKFPSGTWQYGGSTTWQAIRTLINAQLKKTAPQFELVYTRHPTLPNGSGTGIKMLLEGQIAFAQSSRPIEDREYDSAIIRGKILKQVPVAIDGIAVVVNPKLEIDGLTIKQLASIYTGKITNWNQLGGGDLEIIPYTRPLQSGTTEFFRHNILKEQAFDQRVVFLDYPTLALKQIEEEPGGIFFVSVSEVINNCNLKILAIARRAGSDYISLHSNDELCNLSRENLNIEVLHNGEYPLIRRLFVVIEANSPVDEEVGKVYKDYLLSPQGQKLISKSGFIPLRS
jgi:ABC-type phosphate transport system substrate-binding protein